MGFVVNSLPDYINQNSRELLVKSIFTAPTAQLINVQTGVKYQDALHILTVDPVLKERECAFDASGNTTFTQRIVSVGHYAVNDTLCPEDLRSKWMNNEIVTAAGGEVLPFEEEITNEIVGAVQRDVENLIWNASSGAGDLFDGLLEIIKAEGTDASTDASTVYDKVVDVYKAIPVSQIDKAEIFMGVDDFRSLCLEMVAKNLYHYQADLNPAALEMILPGTNTKIHGVSGLTGTHAIVAANPKYLYWATDFESDAEQLKLWYSDDDQIFKYVVKFNLGAQVAFPDLVVFAA